MTNELQTVGAMHQCRAGESYSTCVHCGALAEALNKPCPHFMRDAAQKLAAVASPAPQADSQPAPVLTSETGGDWTQPTTIALRLGDAMQLLCGGKRPPDDMVQQWLDNTSESLQEFAASNGPAWAQGIGLIDAAMVMVDQPTEIRTIDNPDRDHEHRAARAPADRVQDLQPVHDAVTIDLLNERIAYLERKLKEADSVTAPAATPTAASIAWTALRDLTDPLGEAGVKIMGHVRIYAQRQYEAGLTEGRATPPAQAADSVLEDAARLLRQILTASQDGDSDTHLSAHFVSRIETITKAGGAA